MKEQKVGDLVLPLKNFQEVLHSDSLLSAIHTLRSNAGLPLVVLRHGEVVGVVTESELVLKGMQAEGAAISASLHVSDVMTPVQMTVSEETTLSEVLEAFHSGIAMLPLTRQGRVVAVIRPQDILRLVTQLGKQPGIFSRAAAEAEIAMSSPVWQELLNLLAEVGI